LRLGYANLVLAIADCDPIRAAESYRYACNYHLFENYQLFSKIRGETRARIDVLLGAY
jgi:hypothetical protein